MMVPTLRRRRSVVLSVITALIGIILHHHTNSVLAMSWGVTAPYTPTYLVRCVLVATPPNSVSSLVFTFWEDEAVGTRIRTEIYDPIQHSWGAPSAIGPLAGGVMSIAALPASASAAATGLQSEWNAGAVLVEGYSTPAIYHYDLDLLKFTNSDQPMRFNPPALNVAQAIQTLHRMTSDPTHFIATLYQSSPFQLGRITIPNGPHTSSTVWPITFITGTGTAPSAQLYCKRFSTPLGVVTLALAASHVRPDWNNAITQISALH